MVDNRRSVSWGELLMPAHSLKENLFVPETQEISQTAIVGDVSGYTSQAEVLQSFHHLHPPHMQVTLFVW